MPYKDPNVRRQKGKEYSRRYYEKNADAVKAATKKNSRRYRAEWDAWKATQSCGTCGESHPATIDFHHIDPATKVAHVGDLARNGRYKAAMEEAQKCIALCSNCHRKLHYEMRQNKKRKRKKKKGRGRP